MIRVVILDQGGKPVLAKDLATAAELNEAAEQARALIRECDRVIRQLTAATPGGKQSVPYLT